MLTINTTSKLPFPLPPILRPYRTGRPYHVFSSVRSKGILSARSTVNEILLTRNMLFPCKIIFNFSAQLLTSSLMAACAYPQKSRSSQELFNVTLSSPVFIGDSEIILKMIHRSSWTSSVLWNHTHGNILCVLAQQLVLVSWTLLTCSPDLVPPVT